METYIVALLSAIGVVLVIGLVLIIYFVCTRNSKIYKKFNDPAKAEGTVIDISSTEDGIDYTTFYTITYSYSDDYGYRHTASFQATRHPFRKGDKVAVIYDLKNPQSCITEFQLKTSKTMCWTIPLILAAMIIPAFIIAGKMN